MAEMRKLSVYLFAHSLFRRDSLGWIWIPIRFPARQNDRRPAGLTTVVRSQTNDLIAVQNDFTASVRALREQLAEVRKEIETVRLERSRAFSSTAIYGSVEQETRRSRLDNSGELDTVIGKAKAEANNLNRHCEALEDQILRM